MFPILLGSFWMLIATLSFLALSVCGIVAAATFGAQCARGIETRLEQAASKAPVDATAT